MTCIFSTSSMCWHGHACGSTRFSWSCWHEALHARAHLSHAHILYRHEIVHQQRISYKQALHDLLFTLLNMEEYVKNVQRMFTACIIDNYLREIHFQKHKKKPMQLQIFVWIIVLKYSVNQQHEVLVDTRKPLISHPSNSDWFLGHFRFNSTI